MGTEYQLRRDIDKVYSLVYDLQNNEPNIYTKKEVNEILLKYIDESQLAGLVWSIIYPVGSVYMTTSSYDPSTLFGGRWSKIKEEDNIKYWERVNDTE